MDLPCFGSVNFCAFRSTRVDAVGAPEPGSESVYVTEAGVELTLDPQITEGTTLTQKNGCGRTCVSFTDDDSIEQVNGQLTLCTWDVQLAECISGYTLWTDGDDQPRGLALPDPTAAGPNGVIIEAWAIATDGEARATIDVGNGDEPAFWRYIFPKVKWTMGGTGVANQVNLQVWNMKARSNPNAGTGPYSDWLEIPLGPFAYQLDAASAVPDAACEFVPLAS